MFPPLRVALPIGLVSLSLGCFSPNQKADPEASADDSASDFGTGGTSEDPTAATGGTGNTPATSGAMATTGTPETSGPSATDSDGTTSGPDPTSTTGEDETRGTNPTEAPGCGNGELDGDEECDDGPDNGSEECTEQCTIAFCGDELVSLGELCDDGDENGTDLGDCAPDCSKLVDTKIVTTSAGQTTTGDLGPNTIATVDAACEAAGHMGYRAMFADGVNRRATVTPYLGDSQVDWVLTPWTRYVRDSGELIWITDESALLGVSGGSPGDFLVPIREFAIGIRTGLRGDWVAQNVEDCFNWTSASVSAPENVGRGGEVDLDSVLAGLSNFCDIGLQVYCVEQ